MAPSQVQPSSDSSSPLAAFAVLDAFSGRARKALAAYYVARQAWTIGKKWADRGRDLRSYTVTVEGADRVYADLQAWLIDQMPPAERRSLTAFTRRASSSPDEVQPVGGPREPRRAAVAYDGSQAQHVTLAGHRVRVEVVLPSWLTSATGIDASRYADLMRMKFTCPDQAARDALLELIGELAAREEQAAPQFSVATPWGGWTRREHPGRPFDSVILRAGQRERIDGDLTAFLASEATYRRLGTPWHRGYVFHGPPGTGKTSIARALSTHHRLDLYYLPLSAVKNDAALMELSSNISGRAMLLIEDVDIAHGSRVRDDGEPGVTLSGLLNLLDGVATPHGLVAVMTTNAVEVLDDALLRAGRADMIEEFLPVDADQLARMAEVFTPGWEPRVPEGATPADAVEQIKQHLTGAAPNATLASVR